MSSTTAFARFVATYLASQQGRDTPDGVARALLRLDPELCGFTRWPDAARLHELRALIQEIHEMPDSSPADERDALETTGVWRVDGSRKAV